MHQLQRRICGRPLHAASGRREVRWAYRDLSLAWLPVNIPILDITQVLSKYYYSKTTVNSGKLVQIVAALSRI